VASVVINTSTGATSLKAGNNLNLQALNTHVQENSVRDANNYSKYGTSEDVGSLITGGGNVNLSAGKDLNAKAADVQAKNALTVNAGNNIKVEAGLATSNYDEAHKQTSKGFMSSSTVTTRETRNSTTALASNLGGRTVEINAGNDIAIKGSNILSDNNLSMTAANNINIEAAQNTSQQSSFRQESKSGLMTGSGLSISYGNQMQSVDGKGTTYTNAHIKGSEGVSIKSGGDTNLKGATVEGKKVSAQVGGNLNIESLQDTSTYAEKNQQVGGSVMVGVTQSGLASGNVNLAKSNINSNYASVTEQSGLKAGDGGFQVDVKGNTDLKGGAITSTQAAIDNNKNTLNTSGTLTTSDIQNQASYEAKSVSVNVGMGSVPGQSASAGMSGVGFGSDSGKANSTTTAGISGVAGDSSKRTGDKEQGIAQIFNKEQVKAEINAQTAITSEFGKNASKAVGDYAATKLKEAETNNDQAGIAAWREGGSARVALHAVAGGLTGGTAGAIGAGTSQAVIDNIGQAIKDTNLPIELKKTLVAVAGTAVGAAASGGSVAGSATAFNATTNNYLNHAEMQKLKTAKEQCASGSQSGCADKKQLETIDIKRDDDYSAAYDQCRTTRNCKGLTTLDNQMQRDMEWAGGLSKNYESKNDPGAINAKKDADGTWLSATR
jgi:filamentous hemagglutinin